MFYAPLTHAREQVQIYFVLTNIFKIWTFSWIRKINENDFLYDLQEKKFCSCFLGGRMVPTLATDNEYNIHFIR